jgi:hypothetical protein
MWNLDISFVYSCRFLFGWATGIFILLNVSRTLFGSRLFGNFMLYQHVSIATVRHKYYIGSDVSNCSVAGELATRATA